MLLHYFVILNTIDNIEKKAQEIYDHYNENTELSTQDFDTDYYISNINSLESIVNTAINADPSNSIVNSKISQHISYAKSGSLNSKKHNLIFNNISDILFDDLVNIKQNIQNYFNKIIDNELFNQSATLLKEGHVQEATSRGFITLTTRLKSKYPSAQEICSDQVMIDHIFSKKNPIPIYYNGNELSNSSDKMTLSSFIKGNYGLFRNKAAHEKNFPENLATIALENINYLLIALDL